MIVALDFETSNTKPGVGAPVQLGVAVMEGQDVKDTLEVVLAPPRHWKDKEKITREYDVVALQVSGISWKAILGGFPMAQGCNMLRALVERHEAQQALVVAYNAPFDLAWYADLLMLGGDWDPKTKGKWDTQQSPLLGPWQCVLMLARARLDLPDYKLDTVAKHYDLARTGDTHSALEDAILAGRIYDRLKGTQ